MNLSHHLSRRQSPVNCQGGKTYKFPGILANISAELRRLAKLRSLAVAKFETYLGKAKTTLANYKIDGAASVDILPSALNRVERSHADLCSAVKPVADNIEEARNLTADFAKELPDGIASEKDLNTQLENYSNEYEAVIARLDNLPHHQRVTMAAHFLHPILFKDKIACLVGLEEICLRKAKVVLDSINRHTSGSLDSEEMLVFEKKREALKYWFVRVENCWNKTKLAITDKTIFDELAEVVKTAREAIDEAFLDSEKFPK
jgi:hypothetical protein